MRLGVDNIVVEIEPNGSCDCSSHGASLTVGCRQRRARPRGRHSLRCAACGCRARIAKRGLDPRNTRCPDLTPGKTLIFEDRANLAVGVIRRRGRVVLAKRLQVEVERDGVHSAVLRRERPEVERRSVVGALEDCKIVFHVNRLRVYPRLRQVVRRYHLLGDQSAKFGDRREHLVVSSHRSTISRKRIAALGCRWHPARASEEFLCIPKARFPNRRARRSRSRIA